MPIPFPTATANSLPRDSASGAAAEPETIWNPIIIALFGIPLGFLFSSILVALNWHAMRKHWYAGLAWGFGILYCVAIQQPLLDLFQWPWPYVAGIIIWFPVLGLTQLTYLRKHRQGRFSGRPWLLPISLGIALQAALLIWGAHDERTTHPQSSLPAPTPAPASPRLTPQQLVKAISEDVFAINTQWRESSWIIFSKDNGCQGSAVQIGGKPGAYYFVTNRHEVEPPTGATNYHCSIRDGENLQPVEVLAYGKNGVDLALLRVRASSSVSEYEWPTRPLKEVSVGDKCMAVGNALGAGINLTTGVVSRIDTYGDNVRIRTSAPISPGNSGGGLYDEQGFLIGITTASVTAENAQNVNLAIPTDYFAGDGVWDYFDKTSP